MNKRSAIQSLPTPKNWLVSWFDDKELSLGADAIGWNSFSKKIIIINSIVLREKIYNFIEQNY